MSTFAFVLWPKPRVGDFDLDRAVRAAKYMAEFGWRARGIDQGIMLMEKATSV